MTIIHYSNRNSVNDSSSTDVRIGNNENVVGFNRSLNLKSGALVAVIDDDLNYAQVGRVVRQVFDFQPWPNAEYKRVYEVEWLAHEVPYTDEARSGLYNRQFMTSDGQSKLLSEIMSNLRARTAADKLKSAA